MKQKYQSFVFESYNYDVVTNELELRYSFDGVLRFTERVFFPSSQADFDMRVVDKLAKFLWIMAGISYYKAFYPAQIKFARSSDLPSKQWADFFAKVYRHGLGEFFVVNNLPVPASIEFPYDAMLNDTSAEIATTGVFLPIGGGKDSLVSAHLLQEAGIEYDSFFVNPKPLQVRCAEALSGGSFTVRREMDSQLFALNKAGALNGHVPISAIWSGIMLLSAALQNKKYIVLSNEASANVGNLEKDGLAVNHQYSKSLEFENDLQHLVAQTITPSITYFSLLRPLSELQIIDIFSQKCWHKFRDIFASCNKNFKESPDKQSEIPSGNWCGNCSKCAFVFLILAGRVPKTELISVFGGDLSENPLLKTTFKELCGLTGHKPFECVGEIEECRQALLVAEKDFPFFAFLRSQIDVVSNMSGSVLAAHKIPSEIVKKVFSDF